MKTPPKSSIFIRRCSCNGLPSRSLQPSVKQRKAVNMAAGTDSNLDPTKIYIRYKIYITLQDIDIRYINDYII